MPVSYKCFAHGYVRVSICMGVGLVESVIGRQVCRTHTAPPASVLLLQRFTRLFVLAGNYHDTDNTRSYG